MRRGRRGVLRQDEDEVLRALHGRDQGRQSALPLRQQLRRREYSGLRRSVHGATQRTVHPVRSWLRASFTLDASYVSLAFTGFVSEKSRVASTHKLRRLHNEYVAREMRTCTSLVGFTRNVSRVTSRKALCPCISQPVNFGRRQCRVVLDLMHERSQNAAPSNRLWFRALAGASGRTLSYVCVS